MLIDVSRLREVFLDCLFREEEVVDGKTPSNAVLVDGIVGNYGFHRQRLESHKAQIKSWLLCLPAGFLREGSEAGGGWSFLYACNDKEGNQWGEHVNAEQLVCLGIALGFVTWLTPKWSWGMMPGEMPYFVIKEVNQT